MGLMDREMFDRSLGASEETQARHPVHNADEPPAAYAWRQYVVIALLVTVPLVLYVLSLSH